MDPVGEYPATVAVHEVDVPTTTEAGEQVTDTLLCACVTTTERLAALLVLFESPEYEAVTFASDTEVGVYAVEQVPAARVHADGENVPCPVLDQVMDPAGERPITLAVQMREPPTTTVDDAQFALVDETSITLMTRADGIIPLGGDVLTLAHWDNRDPVWNPTGAG